MRSARASASRQRPNGARRSIRLKGISYDVGRKLAAAAWSLDRLRDPGCCYWAPITPEQQSRTVADREATRLGIVTAVSLGGP